MKMTIRKKRYAFLSVCFIAQALSSFFIFCKMFSRKNASAFILITMAVYNLLVATLFAWSFISDNRTRKRVAPRVDYESSDEGLFDFDIDALTDEELDKLLG